MQDLQLYHGYGSKHLIETRHAFGICASYTEVRQFLTSAANYEIAKPIKWSEVVFVQRYYHFGYSNTFPSFIV
jgi:hypothetical protein